MALRDGENRIRSAAGSCGGSCETGTVQNPDLFEDLQTNAAAFQTNVRAALAAAPAADAETGNAINQFVGDFMVSMDRLKADSSGDAAGEVLNRAEAIDLYMKSHPLSVAVQQSWLRLKNNLIRLAAAHNLSPAWLPDSLARLSFWGNIPCSYDPAVSQLVGTGTFHPR